MNKPLDVYLYDKKVGQLAQGEGGRLSFSYVPDATADCRVSFSMPVNDAIYEDAPCRAFFGGLLPEASERDQLATVLGISKKNDFRMLEIIGGDCAGAVSLYHEGEQPRFSGVDHNIQEDLCDKLDEEALCDLFRRLKKTPLLAGEEGVRISLAGAQKKVALIVSGDSIFQPREHQLSTHILKPPNEDFPHMVENELFCMRLAAAVIGGKSVKTSCKYLEPGYPVLIVERYDRWIENEKFLRRAHQEDFCQAMSIVSENKYQSEGGPSCVQGFDLVKKVCPAPAAQTKVFLEMICFNYMIGNHDAHGKNFSFLYEKTGPEALIAPPYDILCTAVYPNTTKKMAMSIGGEYKPDYIFLRHWERLAEECGLSVSYVLQTLQTIADKIKEEFPRVAAELESEGVNPEIFGSIRAVIKERYGSTQFSAD